MEPRPRGRRPPAHAGRRRARGRRGGAAAVRRRRRRPGRGGARRAGPPGRRPPGHHGVRPDARAVRRRAARPAGGVAHRLRRPVGAVHAGLAGGRHRRPRLGRRADRPGVRAERGGLPRPVDDPDGGRDQPLVPLGHDLPQLPRADHADRLPGRQRRRLGALRGPGEVPPDHRVGAAGVRPGLVAPAAADDPDGVLVPAHRPVPLRPRRRRHAVRAHRAGPVRRPDHGRPDRAERADGLDAVLPDLRPQPPRPRRRGRGRGEAGGRARRRRAQGGPARLRVRGPGRAGELPADPVDLAGQPARLVGQGQRVLPQAPARHRLLAARRRGAGGQPAARRGLARGGAGGEARPAAQPGLPADQHDDLLRRRAARRDVVREARPQHHRHAPVHPLVQPRHLAAVADPHRLGRLARHRGEVLRARGRQPRHPQGRRRGAAAARHPRRDGHPARRGPRLEGRRVRAGAGRDDAQDRRGRARLHRGRREDGGARPADGEARDHDQGHHLRRPRLRRLPAHQERPGPRRRRRRPALAAARRRAPARRSWRCPGPPTGTWPPRASRPWRSAPARCCTTSPPSTRASRSPSPTPRPRRRR